MGAFPLNISANNLLFVPTVPLGIWLHSK